MQMYPLSVLTIPQQDDCATRRNSINKCLSQITTKSDSCFYLTGAGQV